MPENRLSLFCIAVLLAASNFGLASDAPSFPYEDEGACPFECCTYREWTVNADTTFYKTRDRNSPVVFLSKKGEKVKGITGVVITLKSGKAITKKTVTLGIDDEVQIPAGKILHVLHYEGEGISKFWFDGKTYSDEIPFPKEETDSLKTETEPETVWWVKVENAKKQIGWSKDTEHFDHMDSCE